MKRFIYIYLLIFAFLCGCVRVDYVGQRLPAREPSEYVMIYPSMNEVPAEYKILGRGKVMTPQYYDMDKLEAVLSEKALEVGADAVAIASHKYVAVNVNNNVQSNFTRPSGSWSADNLSFEGRRIYTDSFGRQESMHVTRTERFRMLYHVVFLTKTDFTKQKSVPVEKK